MATWAELSRENLRAAQRLFHEGFLRSSMSRAYYATYCAFSARLAERGIVFAHGWQNPGHQQIVQLIRNGLALPPGARWQLNRAFRRLRRGREDADYRPAVTVDRAMALFSLHDAVLILKTLEIEDG